MTSLCELRTPATHRCARVSIECEGIRAWRCQLVGEAEGVTHKGGLHILEPTALPLAQYSVSVTRGCANICHGDLQAGQQRNWLGQIMVAKMWYGYASGAQGTESRRAIIMAGRLLLHIQSAGYGAQPRLCAEAWASLFINLVSRSPGGDRDIIGHMQRGAQHLR